MNEPCCSRVQRGPSPFSIIALGWHDGPTSGLARCKTCDQAFHFDLLQWDDEQRMRVYAFAKLRSESYRRLIAVHDERSEDGVAKADRLSLAVRDALAGTFGRTMYILAEDIDREVLACREADFEAWRDFLNGV